MSKEVRRWRRIMARASRMTSSVRGCARRGNEQVSAAAISNSPGRPAGAESLERVKPEPAQQRLREAAATPPRRRPPVARVARSRADGFQRQRLSGSRERQGRLAAGARRRRRSAKLSAKTRSALGREGAEAAARERGASKGTGSGAGRISGPQTSPQVRVAGSTSSGELHAGWACSLPSLGVTPLGSLQVRMSDPRCDATGRGSRSGAPCDALESAWEAPGGAVVRSAIRASRRLTNQSESRPATTGSG